MNAGAVDVLLILGGNPVYDAPGRSPLRRRADEGRRSRRTSASTRTRPRRCASGTFPRRTPSRPGATRAPGTARPSIVQPLIAPLYGGQVGARACSIGLSTDARPRGVRRSCATPGRRRPPTRASLDAEEFWRTVGARRRGGGHGVPARRRWRPATCSRPSAPRRPPRRRPRARRSGPTRRSTTAASPTRLAAGAAEALHQADLGQHGPAEPGHGRPARRRATRTSSSCAVGGAAVTGPGVDRARPGRRHGDGAPRATAARAPGRVGNGVGFDAYALRTSAALWAAAGVSREGHRRPRAGWRARSSTTTWRAARSSGPARSSSTAKNPHFVQEMEPRAAEDAHAVPGPQVRGLRVGHGHRPQRLHRLQRVRGGLPGREQHPGGRQGAGGQGPRDALAPRRHLLQGPGARRPRRITSR